MNLSIILAMIGFVVGGYSLGMVGAMAGGVLGVLVGQIFQLKNRIAVVESCLNRLAGQAGSESVTRQSSTPATRKPDSPEKTESSPGLAVSWSTGQPSFSERVISTPATTSPPQEQPLDRSVFAVEPRELPAVLNSLKLFFTTGNLVAKIGTIILFFGVAFLLKYVAARNMFPVEARLILVAVGAIAMLVLGWRLRSSRLAYALVLQGGSIGILYMDLFGAGKHYSLMPLSLALAVMVGLVVLSGILAVLQDSRALAFLGAAGGFMAPILMSTGSGNHIVLFSYYALLNVGILGIAWFRSWRELNIVGFVFTLGIGAFWGQEYYQPRYFSSTEPFLVFFLLLYIAIPVLFAHRQPPRLKGYVDSTLVFGVPLACGVLQNGLAGDIKYGLAVSALLLGGLYIMLAMVLWRRQLEGMRMLTEAFLALGVVFVSLAIPLALEGRWVAISWAVEGAALVWVGVRQDRLLARNFGLLVQLGAGFAYGVDPRAGTHTIPVFNSFYLSCLVAAIAALVSSYSLQRYREALKEWERPFHLVMLVVGLIWWFGGGLAELDRHVGDQDQIMVSLFFVVASFALSNWLAGRLEWRAMRYPAAALLIAMALCLVASFFNHDYHPFLRWGLPVWLAAFGVQYWILHHCETEWPQPFLHFWHMGTVWFLTLVLTLEVAWQVARILPDSLTWRFAVWGIVPALICHLMMVPGRRLAWPVRQFRCEYLQMAPVGLLFYLLLWGLAVCGQAGDPAPLPYLPLLNPLEITQAYVLIVLGVWFLVQKSEGLSSVDKIPVRQLVLLPAAVAFVWLTVVLARTVHHYGGVAYRAEDLFNSTILQASFSLFWTMTALGLTIWAARKRQRLLWFVGAVLLGVVVAKLFIVDLASTGTVGRIVSFLGVGILTLLIGFFSPLPAQVNADEVIE